MKTLLKIPTTVVLLLLGYLTLASDPNAITARVRVFKNDLDKIYTVYVADTVFREISVALRDDRGTILVEKKYSTTGFSDKFSLATLKNGEYEFIISFEGAEYVKPILLRSKKDVLAESIQITPGYPVMQVTIKPDDLSPINIHVFNMKDELLKTFYWEPNKDFLTRELNIGQFEGYEAKIVVEQNREEKVEQLIMLY